MCLQLYYLVICLCYLCLSPVNCYPVFVSTCVQERRGRTCSHWQCLCCLLNTAHAAGSIVPTGTNEVDNPHCRDQNQPFQLHTWGTKHKEAGFHWGLNLSFIFHIHEEQKSCSGLHILRPGTATHSDALHEAGGQRMEGAGGKNPPKYVNMKLIGLGHQFVGSYDYVRLTDTRFLPHTE